MHGYGTDGWIHNTNNCQIIVRITKFTGHADITYHMIELEKDQKIRMYIAKRNGYFLYNSTGGLIGFIRAIKY